MLDISSPLRLRIAADALVSNWRWLDEASGPAACGAAVKADAYGLGAREAVQRLAAAGCRHFFVSNWREAAALMPLPSGVELSVLHGVGAEDVVAAKMLPARPVLNSVEQVARWRAVGEGQPCDVMVDTGMNRLGLRVAEVVAGAANGLKIVNLLSHLSSADEDEAVSARQLAAFQHVCDHVKAERYSLANSAGICLGSAYHFDLTRPGIALYGGIAHPSAGGHIQQTVFPEARILQIRDVPEGETVGYGCTWVSQRESRIAVINMGYADGYLRCHAGKISGQWGGHILTGVGRVSMDLIAFDVTDAPGIVEGDWISLDYDLAATAARSGLSQYELLTGLGQRFERLWQ
ncbi:MAG TPA: alanine racemase [Sphingopyxis sp.]|nr:alanine racemase [Sphingopyxis sp.]